MSNTWVLSMLCLLFVQPGHSLIKIPLFGELVAPDPICKVSLPKPWPVSTITPEFEVATRKNSTVFRIGDLGEIQTRVGDLERSGYFAPGRQVVFIIHGYMNSRLFPWMGEMKNAILKEEDSTVFITSWGYGAATPSYPQAGSNTQTIATVVSTIADAIQNSGTFKGDPSQLYLYCIGHSLGAQICGQAGRLSGLFDRISGLDPAGPGFEDCWANMRISTESADCVDNIHTDGTGDGHIDPLIPHFGTLGAWGHIDFYPNGGKAQVGCNFLTNEVAACSHVRAYHLFTYTVNNKGKCASNGLCAEARSLPASCSNNRTQSVGYHSSCHRSNAGAVKGLFHLSTGKEAPFC